jgi:hypothetical protein
MKVSVMTEGFGFPIYFTFDYTPSRLQAFLRLILSIYFVICFIELEMLK